MERPACLRKDVYSIILSALVELDDTAIGATIRGCGYDVEDELTRVEAIAVVMETPSRFLVCECDVLSRPALLSDVFIEFNDDELDAGLTYLIDQEAADEIAAGEATILLRSGRTGVLVPRTRIESAFASGCTIDYRERR
jgi:hypothetical protein